MYFNVCLRKLGLINLLNLCWPDVHIQSQKCHIWILKYFGIVVILKTNFIQQKLSADFVEPINLLGLYLSFNWLIQSLRLVSAIFLYQQMVALKKITKMLFISSRSFALFSRYSYFCISLIPFFPFGSHCLR